MITSIKTASFTLKDRNNYHQPAFTTMAQPNIRQLLNTSWTLHRLSPLHHGEECQYLLNNPTALNTYATRLRDQLTGDVLAGLQLGISGGGADEDDTLSKTGALKTCTWETISHLKDRDDHDDDEGPADSRGILIILEYENITYKAALLASPPPSTTTATQSKGSTSLPLLLTKCPSPLRRTLIAFLSTNFDTYCSPLRLPSHAMCDGMDVYMNTFLASDDNSTTSIPGSSPRDILQDAVKDMQITLSFPPSVAPALRSLNINIPRASFGEFLRDSPSSSASHLDSSSTSTASIPFLSSLSAYLEKHLAMKLDLRVPGKQPVRLTKIACGGFVLGSEGRMKLVARSGQDDSDDDGGDRLQLRAVEMLLRDILTRAVVGENVTK